MTVELKVGTIIQGFSTKQLYEVITLDDYYFSACYVDDREMTTRFLRSWVSKHPLEDYPFFIVSDQEGRFPHNIGEEFYCRDVATGWRLTKINEERVFLECLAENIAWWRPTKKEFLDGINKNDIVCLRKNK